MISAKFSYLVFSILCLTGIFTLLQATEKTKIKALAFDFGGVMTQTDHNEIMQFVAKHLKLSSIEAKEILKQLKTRSALGDQEHSFWLDYAKTKGISLPHDWLTQLNETRFHALKVVPGMPELVKNLRQQGFQIALLSNVSESHARIKRQLGLYDFFDPALYSYQIGVRKPDPQAFYILLEQLQLPPESILFIDNKLANIEAARCLGLDAIHFVSTSQLIAELKKRGINN